MLGSVSSSNMDLVFSFQFKEPGPLKVYCYICYKSSSGEAREAVLTEPAVPTPGQVAGGQTLEGQTSVPCSEPPSPLVVTPPPKYPVVPLISPSPVTSSVSWLRV